MKFKKYFIKISSENDSEAGKLLETRLPKQGKSLGEFREIKKAVELLFPKVIIRILSTEVSQKPKIRML